MVRSRVPFKDDKILRSYKCRIVTSMNYHDRHRENVYELGLTFLLSLEVR